MDTKTWIITGATSGLGLALTRAALESGENVVGTGRRADRLATLESEFGAQFRGVTHDVRDTDSASGVVAAALEAFGRVDSLVNNAGSARVGTIEEVDDAGLADMLAQHVRGPAALIRAILPHLRERGSGEIVQMSSQGGRMSFGAGGNYSAGKFALEGLSEALAAEVAPFGIRVLIVEPSRFRTEFNAGGVLTVAEPNAAYDAIVGATRAELQSADGAQEGDPARAATIIRQVLAADDAPLRLPLGAEAVDNLRRTYRESLADVDRLATLSASADFPDSPPSVRAFRARPDAATGRD